MKSNKRFSSTKSCYSLSLSDGITWQLVGSSFTESWLNRFAAIMNLNASAFNNTKKTVLFYDADEEEKTFNFVRKVTQPSSYRELDNSNPGHANGDTFRLRFRKVEQFTLCEVSNKSDNGLEEIVNMWNALLPIYWESMQTGGIPFHAAVAELDGKAIIIAAPGSTGKSTSSRRLPDYWRSMCDDESLVIMDGNGSYKVHPFPTWSEHLWKESDKSWYVQSSAPVAAIFCLEQSYEDKVIPIGEGEAAIMINQSVNQIFQKFSWRIIEDRDNHADYRRIIFANSCKMAKKIPAFRLKATLTGKFWEEIEKFI